MKQPLLVILAFILSVFVLNCGSQEKIDRQMTTEYDTMQKTFTQKTEAMKSRAEYLDFKKEKEAQTEAFLKKLETSGSSDTITLLQGKVLFDLKRHDDALAKFESLISQNSPIATQAKFDKVRVLQTKQDKITEALVIFEEIENQVEKGNDYYEVLSAFAEGLNNPEKQSLFCQKFIDGVTQDMPAFKDKSYMYEILAGLEREKGDITKAASILEQAISKETNPETKLSLESALKQMKLIQSPAPEIAARQWFNISSPLTLAALKGKPVIIDFWATWCPPCRQVIPILIRNYELYKANGLVVIGMTQLYGGYSDDKVNKGKVTPEEEIKLTQEFVKRYLITYPIAIAADSTLFDTYGISGIPTMVMINREGNIVDIEMGAGDETKLEEKIKNLLK